MLNLEGWMKVKDLHRQGHPIRQICRLTGYSRNTVRKETVFLPNIEFLVMNVVQNHMHPGEITGRPIQLLSVNFADFADFPLHAQRQITQRAGWVIYRFLVSPCPL